MKLDTDSPAFAWLCAQVSFLLSTIVIIVYMLTDLMNDKAVMNINSAMLGSIMFLAFGGLFIALGLSLQEKKKD